MSWWPLGQVNLSKMKTIFVDHWGMENNSITASQTALYNTIGLSTQNWGPISSKIYNTTRLIWSFHFQFSTQTLTAALPLWQLNYDLLRLDLLCDSTQRSRISWCPLHGFEWHFKSLEITITMECTMEIAGTKSVIKLTKQQMPLRSSVWNEAGQTKLKEVISKRR